MKYVLAALLALVLLLGGYVGLTRQRLSQSQAELASAQTIITRQQEALDAQQVLTRKAERLAKQQAAQYASEAKRQAEVLNAQYRALWLSHEWATSPVPQPVIEWVQQYEVP